MHRILRKSGASTARAAVTMAIVCAGLSALVGTASASAAALPAGSVRPEQSLPSPACSTVAAPATPLKGVRTALVSVHGAPFGVAGAPTGQWAFAVVNNDIDVLRVGKSLAPTVVRKIPVNGFPAGLTITPDGRYLLAAAGSGAVVISVARAEQGTAGAVLGTLSAPGDGGLDGSAIEAAVSPDGQFAFVTLEYSDKAVVFNLGEALRDGFGKSRYVGSIPLGQADVGMAVSPNGRWLYATSEAEARATSANAPGTLTVINLKRAESKPAASVVVTVDAGCQPVRVITSAGGSQVWVTARASDDLLCFSAARLLSDPKHALVAVVRVGEAPVGLAAVRGGSLIIVADSNRFDQKGAIADLDVVNVAAALSGRKAVVGRIPSGAFPREMTLLHNGILLVGNYESGQLEAVDVAGIPRG
jgi:DNA-binding beta-propeller fold protein YncE